MAKVPLKLVRCFVLLLLLLLLLLSAATLLVVLVSANLGLGLLCA